MRTITLREYACTPVSGLGAEQVTALARLVPEIRISPSVTMPGTFDLTPGSWVGAVYLPGLEVQIHPKISLDRLLFLVSYAVDPANWKDDLQRFGRADSVVEAIAPAFIRMVSSAIRRGLLHGYRIEEDSLQTIRGQIRFGDQLRRRLGIAPPIDVRFDEFSADILENRLLKSAIRRLSRLRLRSAAVARALHGLWMGFEPVDLVEFDSRIPLPTFTRLNRHYAPAVALARLILKSTSFELGDGRILGTGFLLNMNEVFEAFLYRALLESLAVSTTVFRQGTRNLTLDVAGRVRLVPDLSWWQSGRCVFVGDAKYKRLEPGGFKHADLYQLLAYATATQLDRGLLIYSEGEAPRSASSP